MNSAERRRPPLTRKATMTRNDPDGDLQDTTPAKPGALAAEARTAAFHITLSNPEHHDDLVALAASASAVLLRCATELELLQQRLDQADTKTEDQWRVIGIPTTNSPIMLDEETALAVFNIWQDNFAAKLQTRQVTSTPWKRVKMSGTNA